MKIIQLTDTQRKQATDFLRFYKYIYVCNECGQVYGTDLTELQEEILCPKCSLIKQKRRKDGRLIRN